MKLKLLYTLLLACTYFAVNAQQVTITGTVTDAKDNSPMPGVNVVIEGTTQGTITDIDGKYSLKVDGPEAKITVSFIGYASKSVIVGNQTIIDIALTEDVTKLDEIVVVGYGTSKKKDLTGALTTVKAEDLAKAGAVTPEQMLQGKVSGVQIVSNNGEPGAGSQVKVRGTGSITSGIQPLYVIDGIPLDMQSSSPGGVTSAPPTSPLNFINPNDIESMDILKDASAAAIYGSRGANGVILITTKKGKEGASEVSYTTSFSMSSLPKKLDVLSADAWVKYRKDSLGVTKNNLGASTDWQDEIFRTAYSQDHNLSLSGGTSKGSYRASFNYTDQNGIIKNSDLKKYIGRLNLTQKALNDKLNFETNLTASEVVENRVPVGANGYEGDLLLNAIQANPTYPVTDSLGKPYQSGLASERSPSAMLAYYKDLTRTTNLIGSMAATLEIVKGLNFKTSFGMNYTNANRLINQSQKLDYVASTSGNGQINNRELYNYIIENTLNYNLDLQNQTLNFLAGYSYQDFKVHGSGMTGGGYATDGMLYTDRIDAGLATYTSIYSYADAYKMQSYFGRVNYNLMEKYLFTATIRADGSSKFGKNNKYGVFPSFSAAWRLSEESFIKDLNVFSNLKLRLGWGQTGNSEIGTKFSQYLYSPQASSIALVDGKPIIGLVISKTPNPDIKWESSETYNAGLDFGILKGRLSGSLDIYEKTNIDLLLEVPSLPGSPTATVIKNLDSTKIYNKGLEISLNGVPVTTKDFSWDITANMTFQSNIVKYLPTTYPTGYATGQGLTGDYIEVVTEGQPIDVIYGRKIDSIDSKGKVYYLKTKKSALTDSLTYLGDPSPKFTWSLTNNFRYKNFDLNAFFEGVYGNKIFNNTALLLDKSNLNQAKNTLTYLLYDNILAKGYTPKVSDRFVEDGSYIRLSRVTIGYNFNTSGNKWIKKCRLYVSGSNLFVITDYKGYDPDVSGTRDIGNVKSFGIDITSYPKSRTYLMGLNVSF